MAYKYIKKKTAYYISKGGRFFRGWGSYQSGPRNRPGSRSGNGPASGPRGRLSAQAGIQFP